MTSEIKFPIIEMTDSLFESERVFFSYLTFETKYTLKENYINQIPDWKFVDCEGKLLKVKIVQKERIKSLFSFLHQPSFKIQVELYQTGHVYGLEELKTEILQKKEKMFHIYHNKLITLSDYEMKLKNATSFQEIIDIASFEDYNDY